MCNDEALTPSVAKYAMVTRVLFVTFKKGNECTMRKNRGRADRWSFNPINMWVFHTQFSGVIIRGRGSAVCVEILQIFFGWPFACQPCRNAEITGVVLHVQSLGLSLTGT